MATVTQKASVSSTIGDVLTAKLEGVHGRLDGMDSTLKAVAGSLVSLVRLEERHEALSREQARLLVSMNDQNIRLNIIEKDIPPLKEVRKWIIAALFGIFSLLGVAGFNAFVNYQGAAAAEKTAKSLMVPYSPSAEYAKPQ